MRASFRQAFSHFGAFLGSQGVFVLLAGAISFVVSVFVLPSGMSAAMRAASNEDLGALLAALGPVVGIGLAAGVAGFVLNALGAAVGIVVADGLARGETLTLGQAWARASTRVGNLLLTWLLVALAALGCVLAGAVLFFLIVPIFVGMFFAFYLLVRWIAAGPVSVLEGRGVRENLARASAITEGSRGSIFGALLLFLLIAIVPGILIGVVLQPDVAAFDPAVDDPAAAFEAMQPSTTARVVQAVVSTGLQLVVSFVGSAFVVHIYRTLAPTARGA